MTFTPGQRATMLYCALTMFGFDAGVCTKPHIKPAIDPLESTTDFLLGFAIRQRKSQQMALFIRCPNTWKSVPTP